jgi:hypothetical protein
VIRPIQVEELRRRVETSSPFPHFVIDDFLDEDFALRVHDAFPPYEEAVRIGRQFKTVNERKKVQVTDAAHFAPAVQELNRMLAERSWMDTLARAFDLPYLLADAELKGGGMHQTGSRGRLDVHVDFNYIAERQLYRRLNTLIYFNPDWQPSWGGKLELWDRDVKRCCHSLEPRFNRCVVFATTDISFHGVTAVTCPEGRSRKSFATYYYTKEAPPHWDGEHDSIFRSRPNELLRGYVLMPLERAGRYARQRIDQLRWKMGRTS